MEKGIYILIIISITLFISFIILTSFFIIEYYKKNNDPTVLKPPCRQNINISSLVQIPNRDTQYKCIQNGRETSMYYINNLSNGEYDYVVAPWTSSNKNVCLNFCCEFIDNQCIGPDFNNRSAQENYDNCMKELDSELCEPPKPIAAKGTVIYYAISPTCTICDNCPQERNSCTNNIINLNANLN